MKLILALIVLVSSLVASAQSRIVSIDAFDMSYTGGLLVKSDNVRRGDDRDEMTFRFNLNYAQALPQYEGLMWKAQAYFNRTDVDQGSADELDSRFGAAGGLIYNFQPADIKNSFLASALFGLERQTVEVQGADDESGFNIFFLFEGGKRWDMGEYAKMNISYAPTVAFQWKRYGGDIRDEFYKSGTELRFNFLKFDILF
jgi:hypothetical protein